MAGIMALLYTLAIIAATIVVWWIVRRRTVQPAHPRLDPVLRTARRRALAALAVAVLLFGIGIAAGIAWPQALGVPFAVAPLVASAAGLLVYAAIPPRTTEIASDSPRTASLVPRSVVNIVPRRWGWAFIEICIVFIAVIVLCGATASVDERGLSRIIRFESGAYASAAGPYPGWFYGIPALAGLLVLIACTAIALWRISSTPAFPLSEDAELDRRWRQRSVEVLLGLASGAALFSLGGISAIAGLTMGNATIDGETATVWEVVSDALLIGGGLFLVLSVVSVTVAALTATTIRTPVDAPPVMP